MILTDGAVNENVNGSNNLSNLKCEGATWQVRLIEENFHELMWNVEDV
jgi:adenine-specific DNA-methyltransferase